MKAMRMKDNIQQRVYNPETKEWLFNQTITGIYLYGGVQKFGRCKGQNVAHVYRNEWEFAPPEKRKEW